MSVKNLWYLTINFLKVLSGQSLKVDRLPSSIPYFLWHAKSSLPIPIPRLSALKLLLWSSNRCQVNFANSPIIVHSARDHILGMVETNYSWCRIREVAGNSLVEFSVLSRSEDCEVGLFLGLNTSYSNQTDWVPLNWYLHCSAQMLTSAERNFNNIFSSIQLKLIINFEYLRRGVATFSRLQLIKGVLRPVCTLWVSKISILGTFQVGFQLT